MCRASHVMQYAIDLPTSTCLQNCRRSLCTHTHALACLYISVRMHTHHSHHGPHEHIPPSTHQVGPISLSILSFRQQAMRSSRKSGRLRSSASAAASVILALVVSPIVGWICVLLPLLVAAGVCLCVCGLACLRFGVLALLCLLLALLVRSRWCACPRAVSPVCVSLTGCHRDDDDDDDHDDDSGDTID